MKTKQLIAICICLGAALTANMARADLIYSEDFESPVVSGYSEGTIAAGWVKATAGYGASRNGLVNKDTGTFSAPNGNDQAHAFRYTNSGLTSDEDEIGVLEANETYVVTFDVVMDGSNDGKPYNAKFVTFDPSADRTDVRDDNDVSTVLATTTGNAAADGSWTTVSFSYRSGASPADLGKDLAVRFKGATSSANIDNVRVYKGIFFWDLDDTTAGSGSDTTPDGTWDATSTNWNPVAAGTDPTLTWASGAVATFAAGTDASGSYTVTIDGTQGISGLILDEGTVALAAGTDPALMLTTNSTVMVGDGLTLSIAAPFTDGTNEMTLTKLGGGTLTVSGDNTNLTGGVSIQEGLVQFDTAASVFGTNRNVAIEQGGVFSFGSGFGAGNIPSALAKITTSSAGAIAPDNNVATDFDLGTAGLTSAWFGSIGTVTYTGTLTPAGSMYRLGGTEGTLTMNTALTSAGNGLRVSGNIDLANANTYDGATIIDSGTLTLSHTNALGGSSVLAMANGSTLQLRSDTEAVFNTPLTVLTNTADASITIDVDNNGAGTGHTLTLDGGLEFVSDPTYDTTFNITAGNGYALHLTTLDFQPPSDSGGGPNLYIVPNGVNVSIGTLNSADSGDVNIYLRGDASTTNSIDTISVGSNAQYIYRDTVGSWSIGDATWQTSSFIISAGTTIITGTLDAVTGNATDLQLTGGELHLNNAGAIRTSVARPLVITGGNLDNSSGAAITTSTYDPAMQWNGDFTFTGANGTSSDLYLGAGDVSLSADRTVTIQNAAATLAVGGAISGSGRNLIKTGAGKLRLSGANTYTGDTYVNAGTLAVSNGTAIADATALHIASGAKVELQDNETVNELFLNGNQAGVGTWGSTSSDANWTDDFYFSGTNLLTVASEPTIITNLVVSGLTTTSATFNAILDTYQVAWDVLVYWGPTDGTNNPSAWSNSASVGSWTNIVSTNISWTTNGFVSGGSYYYTFRTTNVASDFWASPSMGFGTLDGPVVNTASGATSLTETSATLRGTLTAGGAADVSICWGLGDEGIANTGNWDHVVYIGELLEGTSFETDVTGLETNITYYYRTFAENEVASDWSTTAETFGGIPSGGGGDYSMEISFTNFAGRGTLTNFPALIKLTTSNVNNYNGFLDTTNGWDLRFWTNAPNAGTTLNYEIEAFDSSGDSYIWVQIPRLTNNTSIWATWGGDATQLDCTTNGATWGSEFNAVWHMGETDGLANDATANAHNATAYNALPASTSALIANANDFEDDRYMSIPTSTDFNIGTTFTVSAWLYRRDNSGEAGILGCHNQGWIFGFDNSGDETHLRLYDGGWRTSGYSISTGVWNYVVYTFHNDVPSGSDGRFHVNGSFVGAYNSQTRTVDDSLYIGSGGPDWSNRYIDGIIDEVRISAAARSTNWIWACYMNQGENHESFVSYGTPASTIANLPPTTILNNQATANAALTTGITNYTVYVHWGTTDGGTNAASWDQSGVVGSWTNVPQTNINYNITEIVPGTTSWYTFQASNTTENIWASPSWSFISLGDPPTIFRFR